MKLWKKLSLVTTVTLFLATGVSGAAVIGQTLRYNVEKTTESYRQQLQATAYALGRDIGKVSFWATARLPEALFLISS